MAWVDEVRRGDGEDLSTVDANDGDCDNIGTDASFGDIRLHIKRRVGTLLCLIHTTRLPMTMGTQTRIYILLLLSTV